MIETNKTILVGAHFIKADDRHASTTYEVAEVPDATHLIESGELAETDLQRLRDAIANRLSEAQERMAGITGYRVIIIWRILEYGRIVFCSTPFDIIEALDEGNKPTPERAPRDTAKQRLPKKHPDGARTWTFPRSRVNDTKPAEAQRADVRVFHRAPPSSLKAAERLRMMLSDGFIRRYATHPMHPKGMPP